MFDNLNSLLLDIFKASRISGETYPSQVQEIEAVSMHSCKHIIHYTYVIGIVGLGYI